MSGLSNFCSCFIECYTHFSAGQKTGMFDFEKLEIYQQAKLLNGPLRKLVKQEPFDLTTKDQLRRAAFSVPLNIAESSSRISKADIRYLLIIARGSLNECVAILDQLQEENAISKPYYEEFYLHATVLSKKLYRLIQNLS